MILTYQDIYDIEHISHRGPPERSRSEKVLRSLTPVSRRESVFPGERNFALFNTRRRRLDLLEIPGFDMGRYMTFLPLPDRASRDNHRFSSY